MQVAPRSKMEAERSSSLAGFNRVNSASYDPRIANAHTNTQDGGDENGQHTLVIITD